MNAFVDLVKIITNKHTREFIAAKDFETTSYSERRRVFHGLIAECRVCKGDDEWTLESDVDYIKVIRVPAARYAYIAKMAYWWGDLACEKRASLRADYNAVDHLTVTFADAISLYYRYIVTGMCGGLIEVNELMLMLVANGRRDTSDDAKVAEFEAKIRRVHRAWMEENDVTI